MAASKNSYGNDSISALKGADRVRKRPGVIFGSDGLEGCEHSIFEILSNAIDEAREGYGKKITVTRYLDYSVQVEDQGRGIPVDYNPKEGRYNWDASSHGIVLPDRKHNAMDVSICRDGFVYELHFKKGEPSEEMKKTATKRRDTGTTIRWKPDLEVFTDIAVPADYYRDILKRQAVVNPGVQFLLRNEQEDGSFAEEEFFYENGIQDYVTELLGGEEHLNPVQFCRLPLWAGTGRTSRITRCVCRWRSASPIS